MMKTFLQCVILVAVVLLSSCVRVSSQPQPPPVVVQETVPAVYKPGYVVTTLPTGYRTVTRKGVVYYVDRDTYYRPARGGYVVVSRPY